MRNTSKISEYRSKLDQTLSSPDLVDDDMLKKLVKNQILSSSECDIQECSDSLVDRRTKEVAKFLSMLRSASVPDDASHGGWKVKQDTEELRTMYREGPEGTPYHTILAEGYVDAPIDVCLCISWEVELYKKWWPQTTLPTFKIDSCQCLQRVRTDEQICLVRMKLSRPLSAREALVHLFAFEYFQHGLIVVIANSISDVDSIDRSSHGFTKDGIPDAQDVVRVDLVGGFALQKVTDNRSYFRTIGNLDIKLDYIPPALINFIARQLIGSGFKLYKKEVASVSKGDEDFSDRLKDPLYARIREALYSEKMPNKENCIETRVHRECTEIEEIEVRDCPVNQLVRISPEVTQALVTLEKTISVVRKISSEQADHIKHSNASENCSSRQTGSGLCTSDANHKKITPAASPDQVPAGKITDNVSIACGNGINEKAISRRKRKIPKNCFLGRFWRKSEQYC